MSADKLEIQANTAMSIGLYSLESELSREQFVFDKEEKTKHIEEDYYVLLDILIYCPLFVSSSCTLYYTAYLFNRLSFQFRLSKWKFFVNKGSIITKKRMTKFLWLLNIYWVYSCQCPIFIRLKTYIAIHCALFFCQNKPPKIQTKIISYKCTLRSTHSINTRPLHWCSPTCNQ